MSPRAVNFGLAMALLLAAFLRIAHVGLLDPARPIHSDAARYVLYTVNLIEHGVFSSSPPGEPVVADSYRSPGYPLFLAPVFKMFDGQQRLRATWLIQALVSVLAVLVTFRLARRFLPPDWALAPAFLMALSPHLIVMSGYVLTESLQSLLLPLAVLTCIRVCERPSVPRAVLSGLVLGACYLVNEVALLLPLLFAPLMLSTGHSPGRPVAVMLAVFLLFPAAWMVRNATLEGGARSFDRAIATAAHGTYPDFMYESERFRNYPYREDPRYEEMISSLPIFFEIVGERAAERPLRYLSWYLLEKPYIVWRWTMVQGADDVHVYPLERSLFLNNRISRAMKGVLRWVHAGLLLAFLVGIVQVFRETFSSSDPNRKTAGLAPQLCVVAIVYWTMVYLTFMALPRYGIPWRGVFYLLSVAAAYWAVCGWIGIRSGRTDNPSAAKDQIL